MADKWEYIVVREGGEEPPVEFIHPATPTEKCPTCGRSDQRDPLVCVGQNTVNQDGRIIRIDMVFNGARIPGPSVLSPRETPGMESDLNLNFSQCLR